MEQLTTYTARVIDTGDNGDRVFYIDIQPPINPTDETLGYWGDEERLALSHYATTHKTTRFTAEAQPHCREDFGKLSYAEAIATAIGTAQFMLRHLNSIDEGKWCADFDGRMWPVSTSE